MWWYNCEQWIVLEYRDIGNTCGELLLWCWDCDCFSIESASLLIAFDEMEFISVCMHVVLFFCTWNFLSRNDCSHISAFFNYEIPLVSILQLNWNRSSTAMCFVLYCEVAFWGFFYSYIWRLCNGLHPSVKLKSSFRSYAFRTVLWSCIPRVFCILRVFLFFHLKIM